MQVTDIPYGEHICIFPNFAIADFVFGPFLLAELMPLPLLFPLLLLLDMKTGEERNG
jgi:hypothetical protein